MTHTPGPWIYHRSKQPDNTGGYDYAITDSQNKIIAETFQNVDYASHDGKVYNQRPAEANARLIAAAPELFAILSELLENEEVEIYPGAIELGGNRETDLEEWATRAAAIIAKAKGIAA